MLNNVINKMQVMPASFFNFAFACFIAGGLSLCQLILSFAVYADSDLSLADNVKRVSLVKQAVRAPQSLSLMDKGDIEILLRAPSLKRSESQVSAWHYHGESCALDVYFNDTQSQPEYIEFRALSMNDGINAQFEQVDQATWNDQCLRDVLDAQGVNTPSSVARRPLPSWENPYRS
jgi:hypothetical protein